MVHDAFKKVRVNTVVSCYDHCYSQSSSVNMLLFCTFGAVYTLDWTKIITILSI